MPAQRPHRQRHAVLASLLLMNLTCILSLLSCTAQPSPPPQSTRVYLEPPPGIFTTDASFVADTREIVEDKSNETYTLAELETAKPGLLNRLKPFTHPPSEFHMKPVRVVHARAVADMPVYDNIYNRFISGLGGAHPESSGGGVKGFTAAMDSVTTSSVEGALVYVQSEVINQFGRTVTTRCRRKNDIKFIVFYELLIAQPNASLALFQDEDPEPTGNSTTVAIHEYGPFVSFDKGRCTPTLSPLGQDEFPDACYMVNGNKGRPPAGAFVGAIAKSDEPRALYKNAYWFSFPNSCPLQPWSVKTPQCRASTVAGLCPPGKIPDGVACTYTHNILGFLPLDDLVGITSTVNEATGKPFGNFSEYCRFGGVEFAAFEKFDFVTKSLPFWQFPLDVEANNKRVQQMLDTYNTLTGPVGSSSQIYFRLREKMKPLPTIDELSESNPPCYESVKVCARAEFGCKRETYAQLCRVCTTMERGCTKPPATFAFPALVKPQATSKVPDNGDRGGDERTQEEDGETDTADADDESMASTTRSVKRLWLALVLAICWL